MFPAAGYVTASVSATVTAASTALPPCRSTSSPALVARADADTTMAESAVATLAGRNARRDGVGGVAPVVSPDALCDGLQPETAASARAARAIACRMAIGVVGSSLGS